jgi:hypothetical protein
MRLVGGDARRHDDSHGFENLGDDSRIAAVHEDAQLAWMDPLAQCRARDSSEARDLASVPTFESQLAHLLDLFGRRI